MGDGVYFKKGEENMALLTIYQGLPASGKSSAAQRAVEKSKGRTKRVERDQIRAMLDFGKWSHRNEETVIKTMKMLIRQYLTDGYNVISSDTNLNIKVVEMLRGIAVELGANTRIDNSFLDVPVEECIARDALRASGVGESVIWRMYYDYIQPPAIYAPDLTLPTAAIVDLDGTLADISHRNPFDATDAANDPVRTHVQFMVNTLAASGVQILIFSGRRDTYVQATKEFLDKNSISYTSLVMRPDGDFRKDSVIKQEFFDKYVRDQYNVVAVFDDRPQVCRLWRKLGLPLFDVGLGYEF